jgi:type IV secretion system protein VirD4
LKTKNEPFLTRGDTALLAAAAVLVLAVATVLLGGALSGLLFGHGWAWPARDHLAAALLGLATHPRSPATAYGSPVGARLPGATAYWGTVAALTALQVLAAGFGLTAVLARRARPGLATRRELKTAFTAADAGTAYGSYLGMPVRLRGEDSALTIAPARAGKTTRLAVGRIVDAPGAVVATSTKTDLVHLTAHARTLAPAESGPKSGERQSVRRSHVFDPDRLLDLPNPCRWDAVAGCQDVREALTRARAMVAAKPLHGERHSSFFEGASETVLRCLLHAAALEQLSMRHVLAWARDFTDERPYEILRTHPGAAPGWLEDLRKFARAGAPETVSSTAMSLGLVLKALADERVLDLLCPGNGEGLDVEQFVREATDTLYLLSEGGDGISTAPLVTAFASAVVSAARRYSQSLPGGRLDPPLTLILDEAANVAPLPDLPMLMADGGGRGMTTWAFVQSFAQLRARWGRDGADSIWGASSAKLLLGGCTEADDLEKISRVVGDRWAPRTSRTSRTGLLPRTDDSTSTSRERERILPVQDLARLPAGTALLLYRSLPPALITLPAWWQRPDAARFTTGKASTANASPAVTTKRREATT